ncbi:MAG TPA: hypothetical protein VH815_02430, partial [Acidobacteriota bacterium]
RCVLCMLSNFSSLIISSEKISLRVHETPGSTHGYWEKYPRFAIRPHFWNQLGMGRTAATSVSLLNKKII